MPAKAGIHVLREPQRSKTWMAGTGSAMTGESSTSCPRRRASTSLRQSKTWMAGTGPAMTSVDHGAIGTAIACPRLDQQRIAWLPRGSNRRSTMTATTMPAPAPALKTSSPLYKSLFVQVLVALILGTILGVETPAFAVSLKILSDAFLKLISMIV